MSLKIIAYNDLAIDLLITYASYKTAAYVSQLCKSHRTIYKRSAFIPPECIIYNSENNLPLKKYMIYNCTDLDYFEKQTRRTMLHYICAASNHSNFNNIIEHVLKHYAKKDICGGFNNLNNTNWTPLDLICRYQSLDALKYVLDLVELKINNFKLFKIACRNGSFEKIIFVASHLDPKLNFKKRGAIKKYLNTLSYRDSHHIIKCINNNTKLSYLDKIQIGITINKIPRSTGGGLRQLVALGAQHAYLAGNPETTFFRFRYQRHTNFAVD
jgi:hypothetical protein